MIPDDCAAGAMDTARDPDVCLEENGKPKKMGVGEEQDINDNHTKPENETQNENNGAAMTNGEVVAENKTTNEGKEREVNKTTEGEGKMEEGEGEEEEEEEEEGKMEVDESGGEEQEVEVEAVSEDDDKDSSEDDEDKLVISEGNEKGAEEDSTDENSKEEPTIETPAVTQKPLVAAAPLTAPSSRSPTPKRPAEEDEGGSGGGLASKRSRPLEELVCLDGLSTVSQVEGSLGQVKRDLEAVEFLLKQKEEEWNTLLRLQKRKEELYFRLVRRRQVLLMKGGGGGEEATGGNKEGGGEEEVAEGGGSSSNLLFLPQGGYSTLGGSQLPLMMMSQLIAGSASPQSLQMPQVLTKEGGGSEGGSNISVIDIHTSTNKPGSEPPKVSMTSEAQSKLSKQLTSGLASMKPILPKPMGSIGILPGLPTSLSFTATGHGPQGPTVNVQHLIAAHRKENPNTPPIRRATRGAWRHRYDGDKRAGREQERPPSVSSSSSEADTRPIPSGGPGTKGFLPMNDPSVSYKDVLLRFAELTQIEKQPGSPQISIFPVSSGEGVGKRGGGGGGGGEGSRESTPSVARDHTPPSLPSPAPPKAGLEAPSALAKLLLESRANVTSSNLAKAVGEQAVAANSQYLTLSALLSGSSTTTVKEKTSHSQSEGRSKKGGQGGEEPGSGNPKCQGCHKQRAQFVCAGCGNQWYCSRECQVAAWEEHSEHCNN